MKEGLNAKFVNNDDSGSGLCQDRGRRCRLSEADGAVLGTGHGFKLSKFRASEA